jgi:hypothetical protein
MAREKNPAKIVATPRIRIGGHEKRYIEKHSDSLRDFLLWQTG